jgi:hypothetical protein
MQKSASKNRFAILIPLCALAFFPGRALGQSLDSAVKEEAAKIAVAFKVNPLIRTTEEGGYSSQREAGVSIGLKQLRIDLEKIAQPLRAYRLRWILGHELWHQVQFKDYDGEFPSDDPQFNRLFECQADMMGAFYSGQTFSYTSSQTNDWEAYSAAATAIGGLATDLSDDTLSVGGHPEPEQREMAIFFGMIRAFAERLGKSASAADTDFSLTLKGSAEIHYDEDAKEWSYRMCQKIVHVDSAAVSALVLADESPPWPKENSAGWFKLRYRNTSDHSIRAKLSVILAVVGINGSPVSPMPLQSKEFEFELRPGAEQSLAGALGTSPLPGTRVALIYPRRSYVHYTLVSAEFLEETQPELRTQHLKITENEEGLRPSARLLFSLLPNLAFEAKEKFSHLVSGVCDNDLDEKRCPVNFVFPGASRSILVLEKSGAARIESDLYRGDSRADAVKGLQDLIYDLRAIYPTIKIPKVDFVKKDPSIEVDLSSHASLEASVYEPGKYSKSYSMSVDIKSTW